MNTKNRMTTKTTLRFTACLLVALTGLLALPRPSYATPRTWNGAGADALWSNPTNWGGFAPAVSGDNLIFSGTQGLNNTNDYVAITNTGIAFEAGGFNLYGNPIYQGAGLTNTTGTNVINNNIVLTANRNVVVAGRLTLNGVVGQAGGNYGFTKSGAGELVLAGANTNSGTLTINDAGGIVRVTHPQGLGRGNITLSKTGSALSGFLNWTFPATTPSPTFSTASPPRPRLAT